MSWNCSIGLTETAEAERLISRFADSLLVGVADVDALSVSPGASVIVGPLSEVVFDGLGR